MLWYAYDRTSVNFFRDVRGGSSASLSICPPNCHSDLSQVTEVARPNAEIHFGVCQPPLDPSKVGMPNSVVVLIQ